MRVDCYDEPLNCVVEYLAEVRAMVNLPMIGTVRENAQTAGKRIDLFNAIMPHVDAIDIELGTDISARVRSLAHGKTIIVSEHDFEKTPDTAGLQKVVTQSLREGATIIKIATMAHSRTDVVRLLEFTRACNEPVVTIAMGAVGSISRVIAPLFGSLLTYGYLEKAVAPGQLSVDELVRDIGRYFPEAS